MQQPLQLSSYQPAPHPAARASRPHSCWRPRAPQSARWPGPGTAAGGEWRNTSQGSGLQEAPPGTRVGAKRRPRPHAGRTCAMPASGTRVEDRRKRLRGTQAARALLPDAHLPLVTGPTLLHAAGAPACALHPRHRSSRAPAGCRHPAWRTTRGSPSAWWWGSGFRGPVSQLCAEAAHHPDQHMQSQAMRFTTHAVHSTSLARPRPSLPHLQRARACGRHALVHVLVEPQQHEQALVAVAAGEVGSAGRGEGRRGRWAGSYRAGAG